VTTACPPAPLRHLLRLTDDVGLLEHADGIVPRYEHGYCTDDVARGLVVLCREPGHPGSALAIDPDDVDATGGTASRAQIAGRYLRFLGRAQAPDGTFRNRLGYDRHWQDEPAALDCWGRALWGLGTAAARGQTADLRGEAMTRFTLGARARSRWPRAMAFAALGAAEVLDTAPGHAGARALLADTVTVIGEPPQQAAWPWPAPRLSYANAALAEAVIIAGAYLGREAVLRRGLTMLEWLLETETHRGHLSVTPVGGWATGEPRPAFDQQPIEVAALADACARAAAVTGGDGWLDGVRRCVAWFLGDNDRQIPLLDTATGGGCDGLTEGGRNTNQGAESTLAMISVLQHGQRLAAAVSR
jgi:hypothetical protein